MLALSRRLAILTLFNLPTVPDIATAATSYPFGSVQPSNILLLKLPMPPSRCLCSTDVYSPYRNILVASSTISVWWSMVYFWSGVSVHSHLPCAARTRLLAPAAAAALLPPRRRLIGVSFFTWNAAGSHRRRAHSVNSPCVCESRIYCNQINLHTSHWHHLRERTLSPVIMPLWGLEFVDLTSR